MFRCECVCVYERRSVCVFMRERNKTFIPKLYVRLLWLFSRSASLFRQNREHGVDVGLRARMQSIFRYIHRHTHTHTHIHKHTHTHTHTRTYTHTQCKHTYTHVYAHSHNAHTHTCVSTHKHKYVLEDANSNAHTQCRYPYGVATVSRIDKF